MSEEVGEIMASGKPVCGDVETVAGVCICATANTSANVDEISSGTHSRSTLEQLLDLWRRVSRRVVIVIELSGADRVVWSKSS